MAILVLVTQGCSTTSSQRNKVPTTIVFEETRIYGSDSTLDAFEKYGAEELLLRGKDFFEAGKTEDAIQYFERLLTEFPKSAFFNDARLHLIESYIRLEKADKALLLTNTQLLDFPERTHILHRRGLFQKGAALMILKRYDEAALTFDFLVPQELALIQQIEALVDSGVAHFMRKDRYTSEYRFLRAKSLYRKASTSEKNQLKFFHSQAGFYLAELVRLEFSEYHLTAPTKDELEKRRKEKEKEKEKEQSDEVELYLGEQLEEKCQLLVTAQQRFIRVIREGHVGWASASGYKIGHMYEELYDEMMQIPPPKELDVEGQQLFKQLLKDKVKILLEKAIKVWQSTIDMAIRNETNNVWIKKSEEDLEQMKKRLLDNE